MGFGKTDYGKLREKYLARQQQGVDDTKWFKPEQGRYRFRILPPPENYNLWYLDYGVHYGFSNSEGNFEALTCPRLTKGERCPICEFTKGLWKKNAEADIAIARKFGVKKRFVSNIVIVSNGPLDVRMWAYGPQVLQQLEEHCVTSSGDVVPIDDPVKGVNMKLVVTQKNTPERNFPNYLVTPELPAMAIPDKGALDKLHDIVTTIHSRVKSFDELRSILEAGVVGENDSEPPAPTATPKSSEEEEGAHSAPAKPAKAAPQTAPVDDGDEEIVQETSHGTSAEGNEGKTAPRPTQEELARRARDVLAKRKSS